MLGARASCANEYAKEEKEKEWEKEKNTSFSTKCHGALLKYKRDYLLNNMLVQQYIKGCFISQGYFFKS